MKRRDLILNSLEAFLFAAALSIGNLFCIVTAFDVPVDSGSLVWLCILTAAVCAFVFGKDRMFFPKLIAFLVVVALILLYNQDAVKEGFWIAAGRIGDVYSEAYQWQISFGTETLTGLGDATGFLAAVGILVCASAAWAVCGRHQLWIPASISAALLVPCLMVKDSAPSVFPVVLLTVTYAVLLITQSRRRVGAEGRYALSAGIMTAVLITAICVTSVLGPGDYERSERMERLRDRFKEEIQRHFVIRQNQSTGGIDFISPFTDSTLGSFSWNTDTAAVDLSALGPQIKTGQHAMDVLYDRGGLLYLKGNSFAVYENNGWHALDDSDYDGVSIPFTVWRTNQRPESWIKINTARRSSIMYLPYVPVSFPDGGEAHYDAYVENTEGSIEYTVPTSISAQYYTSGIYYGSDGSSPYRDYDAFAADRYTQVPEETRAALSDIVAGLQNRVYEEGASAADVVRDYVMNSARYSLNTRRMPEDEEFVSWFLNESDTGYCVHFATAAAVLLRCMDIPARYVNGYVLEAVPGDWTNVTQNEAHAWVEYYTEGYGWRMLEVTPASGEDETETEQQQIDQEDTERPEPETAPDIEMNTDRRETEKKTAAESDKQTGQEKHVPLKIVLVTAAVAAAFVIWNIGARRIRSKLLSRGTTNDRTIACYRHVKFLSRLAGERIPKDVEDLAMKARFSQHVMTEDELGVVAGRAAELRAKLLNHRNRLLRIVCKYVFAL